MVLGLKIKRLSDYQAAKTRNFRKIEVNNFR